MSNWKPRLAPGSEEPVTLADHYYNAVSDVYADSGIRAHLPYLNSLALSLGSAARIVELGTGGGDQSTLAFLNAAPQSLDCYDTIIPPSLDTLERLAGNYAGTRFTFHHTNTRDAETVESDLLFVDSWHDRATVEIELARFAPRCTSHIVFHDVVAFGPHGQGGVPDSGINLAIADFLYLHPEWRVERFSEEDNGLLTLVKVDK